LIRFSSRQPPFNEDDDDDDENPQMTSAHAFLQFLAHSGHPMRGSFPAFLRRGRRTGNLQDTEEDFGPEDYEVIQINLLLYISTSYLIFLAFTSIG
jgi:hypothetical protein